MPLYLLRHGMPVLTGTMLGHTDCAVTPQGMADCRRQAQDVTVVRVVTSDLVRASVCADAIAADKGLAATRDPRWRELDFGAWDGHPASACDPAALARFWTDPDADPPPGGERWSGLVARTGDALAAVTVPTLVVTHAGAMRAALAAACGIGLREAWAIDLPYAALLSLRIRHAPTPGGQITGLRA